MSFFLLPPYDEVSYIWIVVRGRMVRLPATHQKEVRPIIEVTFWVKFRKLIFAVTIRI